MPPAQNLLIAINKSFLEYSQPGALFGMNLHENFLLPSSPLTVGDSIKECSSFAADKISRDIVWYHNLR